jgi:hypothetical protein
MLFNEQRISALPLFTLQPRVNSHFSDELGANIIVAVYKKDFLFLQMLKTNTGC